MSLLVIAGANPVYTAPADLDFAAPAGEGRRCASTWACTTTRRRSAATGTCRRPTRSRAGATRRAFDGTRDDPAAADRAALRRQDRSTSCWPRSPSQPERIGATRSCASTGSARRWARRLRARRGGRRCTTGSCGPRRRPAPDGRRARGRRAAAPRPAASGRAGRRRGGGLELVFRPDPTVYDGRFANNGWLQELPKPLTKLTWDNAALMSPATAERLGITTERHQPRHDDRRGRAALPRPHACTRPALDRARPSRRHGDRAPRLRPHARGPRRQRASGFNAYALRTSDAPWFGAGLEVAQDGRALHAGDHAGALEPWRAATSCARPRVERVRAGPALRRSTWAHRPGREHHACTAELQVRGPRLGHGHRPQLLHRLQRLRGRLPGREQHPGRRQGAGRARPRDALAARRPLLRRATGRGPARPTSSRCPACTARTRRARSVCPVAATVHSDEGLNDMVYNRCVGTRYCSNNCPYKVRRFNFFLYSDWDTPEPEAAAQPRRHGAQPRRDGEVHVLRAAHQRRRASTPRTRTGASATARSQTACQQACPTQAIVFGDINDPRQRGGAAGRPTPRNYALLAELNTRPRTTYLGAGPQPEPRDARRRPRGAAGEHARPMATRPRPRRRRDALPVPPARPG